MHPLLPLGLGVPQCRHRWSKFSNQSQTSALRTERSCTLPWAMLHHPQPPHHTSAVAAGDAQP
eukprot:6024458-Amphidinium_carterae.1